MELEKKLENVKKIAILTQICFDNPQSSDPITYFENNIEIFPECVRTIIHEHLVAYTYLESLGFLEINLYPGHLTRINPLYYIGVLQKNFNTIFITTGDKIGFRGINNIHEKSDYVEIDSVVGENEDLLGFLKGDLYSEVIEKVKRRFSLIGQKYSVWNYQNNLQGTLSGIKRSYNIVKIKFLLTSTQDIFGKILFEEKKFDSTMLEKCLDITTDKGFRFSGSVNSSTARDDMKREITKSYDLVRYENFISEIMSALRVIYIEVQKSNFADYSEQNYDRSRN